MELSSSLVYFNIVPVRVRCDDREILVNAFLDQGSSTTLCDQRLLEVLNVPSKEITFGLTTVGATQRMKVKGQGWQGYLWNLLRTNLLICPML